MRSSHHYLVANSVSMEEGVQKQLKAHSEFEDTSDSNETGCKKRVSLLCKLQQTIAAG